MHRFLKGQTDSRAKRMLLRDVWLSYRLIEPDLGPRGPMAQEHGVPVHLFFGTMDSVIKPNFGERPAQARAGDHHHHCCPSATCS